MFRVAVDGTTVTGKPLGKATTFTLRGTAPAFTDGPGPKFAITPGSTVIKEAHIPELRTAIDNVRAARGLTAYAWTDPTLGACAAYADALTPGPTVIEASPLNESRANVLALW
jgi:hypothetical protein